MQELSPQRRGWICSRRRSRGRGRVGEEVGGSKATLALLALALLRKTHNKNKNKTESEWVSVGKLRLAAKHLMNRAAVAVYIILRTRSRRIKIKKTKEYNSSIKQGHMFEQEGQHQLYTAWETFKLHPHSLTHKQGSSR